MIILNTNLPTDTLNVSIVDNNLSFSEYISNPNSIIAISAIIVSILAIYFSVKFNRKTLTQTETHNKLTIEPLISHMHSLLSDGKFREYLKIKNCGSGPAKIKSFKFVFNDNEYKDIVNLYYNHFIDNFKVIDQDISKSVYLDDNFVLASGDELEIYLMYYKTKDTFIELNKFLPSVRFIVHFETLYGETRIFESTVGFKENEKIAGV